MGTVVFSESNGFLIADISISLCGCKVDELQWKEVAEEREEDIEDKVKTVIAVAVADVVVCVRCRSPNLRVSAIAVLPQNHSVPPEGSPSPRPSTTETTTANTADASAVSTHSGYVLKCLGCSIADSSTLAHGFLNWGCALLNG